MVFQSQRESVQAIRLHGQPFLGGETRVDIGQTARSQPVEPNPVSAAMLVRSRGKHDAIRGSHTPKLAEPVKDRGVFVGNVPRVMSNAGILDIRRLYACFEQS